MGDTIDRELNELFSKFHQQEPKFTKVSGSELSFITRFVRDNPETMSRATGLARFQANATVLPNGRLLLIAKGRSNGRGSHIVLMRGSEFGAYFKISIVTKSEPRLAFLIPGTKQFEALKGGYLIIAFVRLNQVEEIFEFNYYLTYHCYVLIRMLELTEITDSALKKDPNVIYDADLLRAEATDIPLCKDHFTREDWLQIGWIKGLKSRYRFALNVLSDLTVEPAAALAADLLENGPLLRKAIEIVASDEPAGRRLIKLIEYFNDREISGECLLDMFCLNTLSPASDATTVVSVCFDVWNVSALSPKATNWGRRQVTYSNFYKTFTDIQIDTAQFPISKDEEAQEFWTQQSLNFSLDGDQYLTAGDLPANWKYLHETWAKHPPVTARDKADESALLLLEEATALRKWTIPPKARVDLKFGPFVAVELTEVGHEVYFVWRTEDERYWCNSVGLVKKGFANVGDYAQDDRVVGITKLVPRCLAWAKPGV